MSPFNPSYPKFKTLEGSVMKTLVKLTALFALFLSACSTMYQAQVYDDVYYSPKNQAAPVVKSTPAQPGDQYSNAGNNSSASKQSQEYTQVPAEEQIYDNDQSQVGTEQYSNPDGSNYNSNSGYNDDDYYDYGYSARLRRFHSNNYFDNYYHDWYTNNYWYSYDPFFWGSSIYLSYNWLYPHSMFGFGWDPWYGWNFSFGYGWGYPYSYWYNPYGYPYYGWGCGYYGYWDGNYGGYWDNYFNSNDPNTYYYGPRKPRTGGNSPGGGRISRNDDMNFGDRYLQAVQIERSTKSPVNKANTRAVSTTSTSREQATPDTRAQESVNTTTQQNTKLVRTPESPNTRTQPGTKVVRAPENPNTPSQPGTKVAPAQETPKTQGITKTIRPFEQQKKVQPQRNPSESQASQRTPQQGAQRAVKPQNNQPNQSAEQRYSKPRTYTSPNYTQPKSSQEYTSPKTERMPEQRVMRERVNPNASRPQSQQSESYSPQRVQRESAPAQTPSYTPDRSSQRSQSTPSYSPSPSRSSGSSSGSGGSRSSGSSSGSGSGKRR